MPDKMGCELGDASAWGEPIACAGTPVGRETPHTATARSQAGVATDAPVAFPSLGPVVLFAVGLSPRCPANQAS